MNSILPKAAVALSLLTLVYSCKKNETQDLMKTNPLLAEWTGPYQGVPAFDKMNVADLQAAMEFAMQKHLEEIDQIAANPEAPTFENTLLAMEKAGDAFSRVSVYYGIWSSNMSTPEFREIQAVLSPKLSEYRSKIQQNEALFQRIKTVYENSRVNPLNPEQQRLTELTYQEFEMNGANLDEAGKARYAEINKELAALYTTFSNNVLHDEENYVTYITSDQLSGLPQSFINAAAKAAKDRGREGEYAITNTRSSMDPFLTNSDERSLREIVWRTYIAIATDVTEKVSYLNSIKEQNQKLKEIAWMQSHVVRAPITRLMSLMEVIKSEHLTVSEKEEMLHQVTIASSQIDDIVQQMVRKAEEVIKEAD